MELHGWVCTLKGGLWIRPLRAQHNWMHQARDRCTSGSRTSAVSYELGGPSKRETLVNYSGYQEQMKHCMNLVVQESGKNPVNYSGYQETQVLFCPLISLMN